MTQCRRFIRAVQRFFRPIPGLPAHGASENLLSAVLGTSGG